MAKFCCKLEMLFAFILVVSLIAVVFAKQRDTDQKEWIGVNVNAYITVDSNGRLSTTRSADNVKELLLRQTEYGNLQG